MATKLVLHTDRISEEQLAQVDQLLNKIVPADIPIEKYNHLIELPWQGIYPDMESNSAWLQKLSLLIKENIENIEFNLRLLIDENKLVLQLGLDTTAAQIAEVESLLDRVLPRNLVTEISDVPMGFRRLEYIENPSKAFINLDRSLGWDYELEAEYFVVRTPDPEKGGFCALIGHVAAPRQCVYSCMNNNGVRYDYNNDVKGVNMFTEEYRFHVNIDKNVAVFNNLTTNETKTITLLAGEFEQPTKVYVFAAAGATGSVHYPAWIRLYSLKGSRGGVPQFDLIPAFDEGSQGPCLFDKVSRKVYRSVGNDDFTYPGAPAQATTYSLRRPIMYAQYTEHGIRRLYCVPEGYASKEEYAEANGFKPIVASPMPEEGYWVPVWHDREDCIELEWFETEPPAE